MAGKTGTSQDFRDAWFVGYTGSLVAGVWLGNDDGTPTKRVSGGNLPVEVWHNFMKTALKDQQPVPLPGGGRFAPRRRRTIARRGRRRGQPHGRRANRARAAGSRRRRRRHAAKNFFERLFGL